MIQATFQSEPSTDSDYVPPLITPTEAEMWTGADLHRLREAVDERIRAGDDSVSIDLSRVKHVPTGFFGLLCQIHDQGVAVQLVEAQPNIQDLIWFQRFFETASGNSHCFREQPLYMQEPDSPATEKRAPAHVESQTG